LLEITALELEKVEVRKDHVSFKISIVIDNFSRQVFLNMVITARLLGKTPSNLSNVPITQRMFFFSKMFSIISEVTLRRKCLFLHQVDSPTMSFSPLKKVSHSDLNHTKLLKLLLRRKLFLVTAQYHWSMKTK